MPRTRATARKRSAVNQAFPAWVGKAFRTSSIFLSSVAALSGTKALGAPKSPSYFGISNSRIRWFRQVFQVSSETTR